MSTDALVILATLPGITVAFTFLIGTLLTGAHVPSLPGRSDEQPEGSLSVITPACNEADTIAASLQSLLASEYPKLEIVAIDDRSTDSTGDIIQRFAESDPRIRGIRIDELPEGWLGKLNAMARGVEEASGDWLLFSDADVRFSPSALRRAAVFAERAELDFLTAFPRILPIDFATDAVFNVTSAALFGLLRPWAVRDPRSSAAAGTGAFLLVRRTAYDAGPGLAWMRMEIADDQMMCALIKRHGGRCDVVNGSADIEIPWYTSLGEMNRKMQKGFFGIVAQFSLLRGIAASAACAYLALFPLFALVPGASWSRWPVLAGWLAWKGASFTAASWTRRSLLPAFAPGLGLLLTAWMVLHGTVVGWRKGGIAWRNAFYPSEQLAGLQRFGRPSRRDET